MPKLTAKFLLGIFLTVGLLWAKSSYGKITGGTFVSTLGATLTKIAEKNPYPWFKEFLTSIAIPNSQIFGFLTLWGEFLTAMLMSVGALVLLLSPKPSKTGNLLLVLGLFGGLFLNIVFWFGFGYTSPSADSLNLLMAVIEAIGIIYILRQA